MKIYAFSGLGADQRIFTYLRLDAELVPIQWIDPLLNESLASYAHRLANQIDTSEPFALLGVSFGGMLAAELSHSLNPDFTILISSAANRLELPWLATIAHKYQLVNRIPLRLFKPPTWIAWVGFPFHRHNRTVAQGIIRDMDPTFIKWAIGAIVTWERENSPDRFHHIHGRLDPILPLKRRMCAEVMGRGHFIVLKKADQISTELNKLLGQA